MAAVTADILAMMASATVIARITCAAAEKL
jgi:hypothetical protein